MSIPVTDQKVLWARAAGRCAFPNCRSELVHEETSNDDHLATIGEIAHIVAKKNTGPRADSTLSPSLKNSYDNLILLCPTHHRIIDRFPDKYTVEYLHELKDSHESWVRENLYVKAEGIGWTIIIQENEVPLDPDKIIKSLSPDYPDGSPIKLKCKAHVKSWDAAKAYLEKEVGTLLCNPTNCRFATFSLARISSATHLGYLLTSRVTVRYAQFNRDAQSWAWPTETNTELPSLHTTELLEEEDNIHKEFVIKVSLSAQIRDEQIEEVGLASNHAIELFTENPSEDWLQSERQIIKLGQKFRQILTNLRNFAPSMEKIHLFYAGPTSGAIAIGRQINPRMNPLVQLYEFDRNQTPNYQQSMILRGG